MPLLATFIGSIASALVTFFARFLSYKVAIQLAAFTTWLAVITAFAVSVHVCLASLYGFVASPGGGGGGGVGGSWVRYLWMGLGMFIPANAGAVMSCIGSVWIATEVYKIRKTGIQNFSK